MSELLIVSIVGALFSVDSTAVGQFMFSRPIFCGPVIGIILGDIGTGIRIGIIMELIWITVVPMGVALPPDSSIVTSIATYLSIKFSAGAGAGIVFYILLTIPAGILYKKLDIIHRKFNSGFIYKMEKKISAGEFNYINKAVYLSAFYFFLKGFLFLLFVNYFSSLLFPRLYRVMPANIKESLAILFYILPAVGLGTAVTTFLFKKSKTVKQ